MSEKHTIAVLEGDEIGPEIMAVALKVLHAVESGSGHEFELRHAPFGGKAWFDCGSAFPDETKRICDGADAILKGPIGLSFEESKKIPIYEQPERGALLPLRRRYNPNAKFRPAILPRVLAPSGVERARGVRLSGVEGGSEVSISPTQPKRLGSFGSFATLKRSWCLAQATPFLRSRP